MVRSEIKVTWVLVYGFGFETRASLMACEVGSRMRVLMRVHFALEQHGRRLWVSRVLRGEGRVKTHFGLQGELLGALSFAA